MVQLYVDVFELMALALVAGTDYMDVKHFAAASRRRHCQLDADCLGRNRRIWRQPQRVGLVGRIERRRRSGFRRGDTANSQVGTAEPGVEAADKERLPPEIARVPVLEESRRVGPEAPGGAKLAAEEHRKLLEKDLLAHEKTIRLGDPDRRIPPSQVHQPKAVRVERPARVGHLLPGVPDGLRSGQESGAVLFPRAGSSIVNYGHWDDLRSGLTSGEHLMFDIKRLETAYLDRNKREFEVTKNISLSQLDPIALLSLRYEGRCTFSIPEALFDLDCSGPLPPPHQNRHPLPPLRSRPPNIHHRQANPNLQPLPRQDLPPFHIRHHTPRQVPRAPRPPGGDTRFVYNVGTSTTCIITSTCNSINSPNPVCRVF